MTSITNLAKFGYDLSDNTLLYVRKSPKYDSIELYTTLGDDVRHYPNAELRDVDYENLLTELQAGGIPCYHIAGYAINSNAVSKLYNDKNVAVCVFVNGQRLTIVCGSVSHAQEVIEFIASHAIAGGITPDIQAELDKKANAEDVYTKTQTDALIENINSFNVKIVDQLPTEDIDTHTIYFVPKVGESIEVDGYDEYLYIDGKWEYLGNTVIDLSDYATVEQLNKVASDVDYIGNTVIPEMNTNTAKALDTKVDWDSTKTVIPLPKNGSISALRDEVTLEGGNLLAQRTYDEGATYVTEVGTVKNKLTLNGSERPQVDLAGGTSEKIAYESEVTEVKEDLNDIIPIFVQIPIRTLKDEVYDKATILGWFGVEDDATLKGYISRQHPMFLKYGISLSYNPHYYKFPVEYIAYETANQIKMVFSGLNTKDDVVSKYQIILNLDGKLIENTNSNVGLTITSLEEGVESYNELTDRPQINSIELSGNKSLEELGIQPKGNYVTEETLTSKDYVTNTQLTAGLSSKANKSEIPTKVSELENDSGFITSIPEEYVTEKELSAKGYATTADVNSKLESKANKSTTLTGYGITDAYTKSEVDAKVSSVYKFKGSVANFEALPSESNVVGDVYNVEDTGANYAWDGSAWDKLSETVDLTSYALKSEIPTKVSQLNNDSNYVTEETLTSKDYATNTQLTSGLATKVNSEDLATVATTGSYNDLSDKPSIPEQYTLPIATSDSLGGVKIGNGISIDSETGVISVAATSNSYNDLIDKPRINSIELSANKTLDDLGIQAKGNYLTAVDIENKADKSTTLAGYGITDAYTKEEVDGKIPEPYSLPIATAETLGGIKVGEGLSVTEDGTLSSTVSETTDYAELSNKPQINNVELSGNKSLEELGIQPKGNYLTEAPVSSVNSETGAVVVKSIQDSRDNTTMWKIWSGTQEEYDALEVKDENTIYYVKKDGQPIDVYELLDKKQDKLTAGTGVELVVNEEGGTTTLNNTSPNVQSDWNSVEGLSQILNKPTLATVATSGKYSDLLEIPENITAQGNTFNGISQLVQLDESGKLPALDGSQLTNLTLPTATTEALGLVKPDGTTISITPEGVVSVVATTPVLELSDFATGIQADKVYKATINSAVSIVLPSEVSNTDTHSIIIYASIEEGGSIADFGTTYFYNAEKPVPASGDTYDLVYVYNPARSAWVCNAIKISTL